MKPWNHRLGKTAQILMVPVCAFQLGILSQTFSGSGWAWAAVILNFALLAFLLFISVRAAWKDEG
jgi:hypothetical protein